jgi:3-isopropylmalate/(R)-2-methylmalate dehydratase small subunit
MNAFPAFASRAAVLAVDDIDTDQIIPARFLKITDKAGLAAGLFAGWRYRPDGSPDPGFVLNRPENQGARILLAGRNFGCGSSREHAPWALVGYGFQAVIAPGFGDIFRNNALKNRLLPVAVAPEDHARLLRLLAAEPGAPLTIDLEQQQVALPDGSTLGFPIDAFSKTCLLDGVDELGYLLGMQARILAYEQAAG